MGKSTKQKAHETYEIELARLQKELYIQAFIAYEESKEQKAIEDNTERIKGTLLQKKQFRKKAGKIYSYTYHYIQTSEYKDGKRKIKKQYVPKDKLPQVMEALQKESDTKGQRKMELQESAERLKESEKQLQNYIHNGILPDIKTLEQEARRRYELQKQAKAYREKEVIRAQENPAYKIMTQAGELVLSKNECIVANILYHQNIPYFYEKPLRLKPRKDGAPVVLRPDFTVKVDGKEIYIEILGMLEKEEYATSWEYRLATYKINDIRLGKNLVALEFPSADQHQTIDCLQVLHVLCEIMKNRIPENIVCCGIKLIT